MQECGVGKGVLFREVSCVLIERERGSTVHPPEREMILYSQPSPAARSSTEAASGARNSSLGC